MFSCDSGWYFSLYIRHTDLIELGQVIFDKLKNARKYAEGRGIKIDVNDTLIEDIKKLVEIKLSN